MNVLDSLPRPFFVLAPMDDVTDSVFRRMVGSCAPPDLYFTEFVNVDGLRRMAALNGTVIPAELEVRLDEVNGQPGKVRELAVEVCTPLIAELLEGGAPGVHLYTLNFPRAAREIWANVGLGR